VSLICGWRLRLFCFHDPSTSEIYTLSLHDALPICPGRRTSGEAHLGPARPVWPAGNLGSRLTARGACFCGSARARRPAGLGGISSEEHTSELQSRENLVCRLLLEEKKNNVHVRGEH